MGGRGGACPSSGPAGPPSPEGEGKGCNSSRGVGGSGSLRGASGTPPPTGCPGMGGDGRSRRGGGTPPCGWGDMETLWGLRGHPFPGHRTVGAGHARPGGLRGHPSTVRSVGRGLDPSAGVGGSGSLRGWSPGGWAAGGEPAPHPALRGHLPPRGKARVVVGGSASLRGASGTPPLRVARECAVTGACPSSGPAGPPSPEGEGKGCCWRQRKPPPTPAAGPRCGAGGSGCSTSGLTKPALYRRNPGRCRGGSRR